MADTALIKRNVGRMVEKGAPESDIDAYLQTEGVTAAELQSAGRELASTVGGFAGDVAKSAGVGVGEGLIGLAGIPGDVRRTLLDGAEYLAGKMSPEFSRTVSKVRPSVENVLRRVGPLSGADSGEIKRSIERHTGEFYQPQSTTGEYARTLGQFAPNAISPGTLARRVVGGVVAPALASEAVGQATKGTAYEPAARIAAAIGGSMAASGAVSLVNRGRDGVKGVSTGASKVLEKTVTPGAEARLAELGPDAFLHEATPGMTGIAQGIATRPGEAQSRLVNALQGRQSGANTRLRGELDETLGPAVSPQNIERDLVAQRESLQPLYQAVTGLNVPVNVRPIHEQLRLAIREEAGATQHALRRIEEMIAPAGRGGERIVKSTPREILNVRQALDDELLKLADQPKAHSAVTRYRVAIDNALAEAVPDIKVLDRTYAGLAGSSTALQRGAQVLKTGPEAIRPEDLIRERAASSLPQREAMRHGTRAELDRQVGTKANDITALKQVIQGDGDWNRVKLAEMFGGREAQRIINSVDREAAFQDSYRKLVENSQTAQRLQGAKMVDDATAPKASMRDLTVLGAVAATGKAIGSKFSERFASGKRASADDELSRVLSSRGSTRDDFVTAIRQAQSRRKGSATSTGDELLRAILAARTAIDNKRDRERR